MDEGSPWGKPGDWSSSVPARLCAHTCPLLPSSQPWLLVQAPLSLLLLNFHFPATLKGPLAPAYPARTYWSLLRHSSMFPHQFRGKNSTYWMAYSPPGRHTNRTENTEGSSAELAQAGAPERLSHHCSHSRPRHRAVTADCAQGGPVPWGGHCPWCSLQTWQQINRLQRSPNGALCFSFSSKRGAGLFPKTMLCVLIWRLCK